MEGWQREIANMQELRRYISQDTDCVSVTQVNEVGRDIMFNMFYELYTVYVYTVYADTL
jgi:hypothetical protein